MKIFFVHFVSSRSSCSTNSTTADEDDDFQVRARSVDCPPAAGSQIEEAQLPGEPVSAAAPIWSRTATMKSMTTMK